MTTRYNIGDFNIANPVYAGATVSFYTVSGGAKTATLATLYAASTGTTQGSNPATLDSDGKLTAPLYSEVPVVATISGLGSVDDHDTGIMGLAEGAASTSATAAAASQVAAAASASAASVSAASAASAVSGIGQRGAATVGGTVDAITATFSPVFASLAASAGIVLAIPLAGANATTTPTLAIDGLTAKTIVKGSNAALVAGDIPGGDFVGLFVYDQSLDKFQLINPASSALTISQLLDLVGSAAQGDVLYRGASGWTRLAAGTSGHFLKTQGAGANPIWASAATGTLTAGTPCTVNATIATSTKTTQAHGLGAQPTFIETYIENVTTDLGYAAGDRVRISGPGAPNANTNGFAVTSDTTNVYVSTSSGAIAIVPLAGGVVSAIDMTKWKLVATPYKLN